MNHNEILSMCRRIAKKYKDPREFDDLVSEGYIKALGLVEEGKTDKNLLYSHAKGAMHEYYNLSRGAVKVPKSSKACSTTIEQDADDWTTLALQNALYGEVVQLEDHMLEAPSSESIYEKREFVDHVINVAGRVLNKEDLKILHMRYWQGLSQDEVGEVFDHSKMWVSRREYSIIETIRNNL